MLFKKLATLLLVAVVVGTGYSKDCRPPTLSDLEEVIPRIILAGESAADPVITVMSFNVVCRSYTEQRDRLRGVSAVVQYNCTGHFNCRSGTVVEQIEFGCGVNGKWTNNVEGSTDPSVILSQTTDATLSTTAREDCSACLSSQLAGFVGATTDSVTHCVGK